jgi:molybdopterin synthase sulfur carrier subunit
VQISIRFFTVLREVTGKKEETIEFQEGEKSTIDTVLKNLSKRYGKRFSEYLYDPQTGEVKHFLQFLVNGKSTYNINGLETELANGDVIAIIPPVGGG